MSFAEQDADIEQPEGQDDTGSQSDAPYAEYLNRVPEELRGDVEPVFRDWDANVTRRFQDASEFRKQWEPLADTGIAQYPKEDVAWMISMREAVNDPETMKQWIDGYAKENGLTFGEAAAAVKDAENLDDFQYQDPAQQMEKMLEEKLSPLSQQVQEFNSWREQQSQQAAEADALRFIEGQVAALEEKHGAFDEKTRDVLNTLAGRYIESDPMNAIAKGFDDYQALVNSIEKATLQDKVDAPSPAERGGIPDVSPEKFSRIDSPGVIEAARDFLRNSNRA